jgi:DNA modification methylase
MIMKNQILQGNVFELIKTLPDKSVNCCVTSPPYYGLRDYGVEGQLGLESTPELYVEKMVEVFRGVMRIVR